MTFLADNYQIITAFSSIIIAILALFLSLYEGSSNRKHNRLSVRPYLVLYQSEEVTDDVYYRSVALANNGLGPAIVKKYEVFHDGVILGDSRDANALIAKIDEKVREFELAAGHERVVFSPGHSIRANEVEYLVKIQTSNYDKTMIRKFDSFISNFKINVEYDSIYDENYSANV